MNILEILGNIGFDWRVALANFVNFLVIFFILKKFAFGPIQKVISDRQKKISDGIENAKKAETALFMAKEEVEKLVEGGKTKANQLVHAAHKKEKEIVEDSVRKAEEKSKEVVVAAQHEAEREKKRIEESIRKDAVDLVVKSTEKFVREKFDNKKDEEFIEDLIKQHG